MKLFAQIFKITMGSCLTTKSVAMFAFQRNELAC